MSSHRSMLCRYRCGERPPRFLETDNMTARVLFAVLLTARSCLVALAGGSGGTQTTARDAPAPEISTAAIPQESPLASRLSHVPDITVETIVGTLPRLPVDVA